MQDLQAACEAGADALGFVFYEKSPRHVSLEAAAELLRALPPFVQSVGLFVNAQPAFIEAVLNAVPLDLLQFHGDETPAECARHGRPYIKAVRVNRDTDLLKCAADFDAARGLLLDAGGHINGPGAHALYRFGDVIGCKTTRQDDRFRKIRRNQTPVEPLAGAARHARHERVEQQAARAVKVSRAF
jgi:hypothetical protein